MAGRRKVTTADKSINVFEFAQTPLAGGKQTLRLDEKARSTKERGQADSEESAEGAARWGLDVGARVGARSNNPCTQGDDDDATQ